MPGSDEYLLRNTWLFNDGSGSTVTDSSDSNNLTISGSPTWGADYLSFDGTAGEYCTSATQWAANSTIDPRYDNNYFWLVKLSFRTSSASQTLMWGWSVYTAAPCNYNTAFGVGTDGKAYFIYNASADKARYIATTKTVTDGAWHEAILWSCGGVAGSMLYGLIVDGELIDTNNDTIHSNSSGYVRFGGGIWMCNEFVSIPGFPDEVAANHSFVGDIKNAKAYWWNGCAGASPPTTCCDSTVTEAEKLIEYVSAAMKGHIFQFSGGLA